MALENIAWAIDGGIVSSSTGRMLAYHATSGEEGIAGFGDFLVRQTTVASSEVRVASGGATIINRYPGVKNESYMVRAGDETEVAIPENAGGATRYDLLICRVDDWNMPGGQPIPGSLPTNSVPTVRFEVITGVSSATKTAAELALNYPAIALARIAIPAATAAVTQAMITDLRELVQPRRKRDLRCIAQTAGRDNSLTVVGAGGERFPDNGIWDVEVPYWATKVSIKADWSSLYVPAGAAWGALWIRFADQSVNVVVGQQSVIDLTTPRVDPGRADGMTADYLSVPAAVRGTTVKVAMMGRKLGGTVNLKADAYTCIAVDMEFLEAPTEDV